MSKKEEINRFIRSKIDFLQSIKNTSQGKYQMALLRRGLGKVPGEVPEVFGVILQSMPESFLSKTGKPTREEWACYISLTLYACHRQGNEGVLVDTKEDKSMGVALGTLANSLQDENAENRCYGRLQSIVTASDIMGFYYHLRSAIKLIADANIALNYAKLGEDIYEWQFHERKSMMNLRWGQDFYRIYNEKEKESDE